MLRSFVAWTSRYHWLLLMIAAAPLLFPSPTRSLALVIVPGLWILIWASGRPPLPNSPHNVSLLLLSLALLVSLWATYDLAVSLPKISGIVLGIGAFYATFRESARGHTWWYALLTFLAMGLGIASLGLIGTQWISKIGFLSPITSRLVPRLVGLPGSEGGFHPNYIAGALLWVIPVALAITGSLVSRRRSMFSSLGLVRTRLLLALSLAGTGFLLAVFVLTQSRGGYLALGITAGIMFITLAPGRWRRTVILLFVVLSVIAVGFLARSWPDLDTFGVIDSRTFGSPTFSLNTFEDRLQIWSRAIVAIQDFPFTGLGLNTFRTVIHIFYPIFSISPDFDIGHAHNEFLQVALDLGIPGLIAFLALHVTVFTMLIRLWIGAQDQGTESHPSLGWSSPAKDPRLLRPMVVGLGGGVLAHGLYGLTDAIALGAKLGILFWILLGLVTGLHYQAVARHGISNGNYRIDLFMD